VEAKFYPDLEYAKMGARSLQLNLAVPETGDGPFPVIVFMHGGAFSAGDRTWMPPSEFVSKGYALASIDYRLSGEAVFPAAVIDCKSAVRWLRAHAPKYWLNPERVGLWGISAGGYLTAFLGTTGAVKEFNVGEHLGFSSAVQAVCDWYGPIDFLALNRKDGAESAFLGGPALRNQDQARKANPIAYINKDVPPFLILHGDKDVVVPIGQSELLDAALKNAGADVTFHVAKGAGHGGAGFDKPDSRPRMLMYEFFDRHLKKN
jgi:acetyl esterase/lipase